MNERSGGPLESGKATGGDVPDTGRLAQWGARAGLRGGEVSERGRLASQDARTGLTGCDVLGAGRRAEHNAGAGLRVVCGPPNNGKGMFDASGRLGERSYYPRPHKSGADGSKSCTTSETASAVRVDRLSSTGSRNGPLRDVAGQGGAQASRAYQKDSKGSVPMSSAAISVEAVGSSPLFHHAESIPVHNGAWESKNRGGTSTTGSTVPTAQASPSTSPSYLTKMSTGNNTRRRRLGSGSSDAVQTVNSLESVQENGECDTL